MGDHRLPLPISQLALTRFTDDLRPLWLRRDAGTLHRPWVHVTRLLEGSGNRRFQVDAMISFGLSENVGFSHIFGIFLTGCSLW